MILVLLGTQNNQFTRILEELEKLELNEDTIVQAGYTKFTSSKMKIFDFISKEELEKLTLNARLVITHGGIGSILGAINKGKKVIAVPRLKKYKEHVNDHQLQIVENFEKEGYIKAVYDVNDLYNIIVETDNFTPLEFKSNNENFIKLIEGCIEL